MKTCQICLKPIEECRESGKQLITPYDPRNNAKMPMRAVSRRIKVFKYMLGCYNPENDTFYLFGDHLKNREIIDSLILLPLCVYEGDNYVYKLMIYRIVQENIFSLPLCKKYHNLLERLFIDDLDENLPDLSKTD